MKAFYFWMVVLTLSAMLAGAATTKATLGVGDWIEVALFMAWGGIAGAMLAGQAQTLQRIAREEESAHEH